MRKIDLPTVSTKENVWMVTTCTRVSASVLISGASAYPQFCDCLTSH